MMNKTTLTALAAGIGLLVSSSAGAWNLGKVWVTDQKDGSLYIYSQRSLNYNPAGANPTKIDLVAVSAAAGQPVVDGRNHLIGFNNKRGTSRRSRAVLAYLAGDMQIWKTRHRRGDSRLKPIFTDTAPSSAASLHMCGGNPQNTEIMCSSIGGKELVTYSTNYRTDTYARTAGYPLGGLVVNGAAAPGTASEVADMNLGAAKPICNNYSTDGSLVFVTTTAGDEKGVLVLDASDMSIINAISGTAVGCGLVNSPDGTSMWTNAGSNSDSDSETAMRWDYATVGSVGGPSATVALAQDANGDVHGAQFAGLGGSFLWELMRLDNKIHVIEPSSATVVNVIDMASVTGIDNLGGDVLDRSALGTRMYMSTRGYVPITAIGGFVDANRNPGVTVVRTFFGYGARNVGHSEIRSGVLGDVCLDDEHGDHDHEDPDCPAGSARLDNADPHGLKSLSYLSGGF